MSYENPYRHHQQPAPDPRNFTSGYGYPQPVQPPDPPWLSEPPRNGLGIASLALALCALVPALVPLTGWLAVILGFLAVLFGGCGLGRVRAGRATNRAMCWFGLVIGIAATLLGILGMVMFFQAMDKLSTDLEQIGPRTQGSASSAHIPITPALADPEAAASGAGPVSQFGDVTGRVIGQDIEPGTYRNADPGPLCYWRVHLLGQRMGKLGSGEGLVRVELRQDGASFDSAGCGTWTKDAR
jgi:hypothetical protein